MLNQYDVAKYFLSIDSERQLFNRNLVERNGRKFYEGNAKLNKFMHLAQNLYVAKTGELLMNAVFYAYDNGAVIPEIQENYIRLLSSDKLYNYNLSIPEDQQLFLKKVYIAKEELVQLN